MVKTTQVFQKTQNRFSKDILFFTENQKGEHRQNDLPLPKGDISTIIVL
jgi:hypothetical protein